MTLRGISLATCLTGLTLTGGAIWVINDHYQRTLQREIEENTGQVGQLRVQAEALRVEQADRRRELDTLRLEISRAETALATAQAAAEDSKCLATHARVDAAVTLKQVQCYKRFADHAGCVAANERTRSDNTLFGVLAGAGLALATGGSSLLLTAGGGMIGASSGGSRVCPAPDCVLDEQRLRRTVLAEEGIPDLPQCQREYESVFLTNTERLSEVEAIEREILDNRARQ